MSIYSYISSYFIKSQVNPDLIKKPEICFNNKDLLNQKLILKPCVNKSIGRNIPKHISNIVAELNYEKNILSQILGVKLKKTNVNPRQVIFLPRSPVLLEILVKVPVVN
jgi:hypothetical protein